MLNMREVVKGGSLTEDRWIIKCYNWTATYIYSSSIPPLAQFGIFSLILLIVKYVMYTKQREILKKLASNNTVEPC